MQKTFDELHSLILKEYLNTSDVEQQKLIKKHLFEIIVAFNRITKLLGEKPQHNIDIEKLVL